MWPIFFILVNGIYSGKCYDFFFPLLYFYAIIQYHSPHFVFVFMYTVRLSCSDQELPALTMKFTSQKWEKCSVVFLSSFISRILIILECESAFEIYARPATNLYFSNWLICRLYYWSLNNFNAHHVAGYEVKREAGEGKAVSWNFFFSWIFHNILYGTKLTETDTLGRAVIGKSTSEW